MGYYVQVPKNKGKALQIKNLYGGEIIPKRIRNSKALSYAA